MDIADNIIRNKLKNVYFIWGRGKTTVADILRNKYGCFVFSTDEARDRNMAYACPENQPCMCRDFVKEYGVKSFWELPREVIKYREEHFLREVTPMIVADLIAVSAQYDTVICEGDIDYEGIISAAEHFVWLNNCGTKFDWFDRPDHENIVEITSKRTDLTDEEKAAVIQNAYNSVSGNEGVVPRWVTENGVKVIPWDDSATAEETAAKVAEYFGFDHKEEAYKMKKIERYDINENWAHSGIVRAGDFYFLNYCVRDLNGTIEQQVNGAFDVMEERLALVGLTLENVVQMNCLFKNIWDIPVMEKVVQERFNGKYPARKSIQTEFADPNNLLFQVDAVAYSASGE